MTNVNTAADSHLARIAAWLRRSFSKAHSAPHATARFRGNSRSPAAANAGLATPVAKAEPLLLTDVVASPLASACRQLGPVLLDTEGRLCMKADAATKAAPTGLGTGSVAYRLDPSGRIEVTSFAPPPAVFLKSDGSFFLKSGIASLDARAQAVRNAVRDALAVPTESPVTLSSTFWVVEVYDDHVIVQDERKSEEFCSIPYSIDADGVVTVHVRFKQPVARRWIPEQAST